MSTVKIRLGIVVAEFNYDVTYLMLQKALEHARFLGAEVTYVVKVPGTYDMPLMVVELLKKEDVDAVAVIGAVIQGETKHDELVAHQTARKLMDLSVEYGKPVGMGIIGPGASRMQALERAEEYARRAVEAAVKLSRRLPAVRSAKYMGTTVFIE
ncbi:MAG: 6,7-dimethyl-8-ribityllumazine synthase [Vulcanisaeta sp. AZ3]